VLHIAFKLKNNPIFINFQPKVPKKPFCVKEKTSTKQIIVLRTLVIYATDHKRTQPCDKRIYVATIPNHLKLLEDSA